MKKIASVLIAVFEVLWHMMLLSCSLYFSIISFLKGMLSWDFPGGPVVKTSPSKAGGMGLIPGQGANIAHARTQTTEAILCNKFSKHFTDGPH